MAESPNTSPNINSSGTSSGFRLSLDWWAVIAALALTALVLLGIIQSIPW